MSSEVVNSTGSRTQDDSGQQCLILNLPNELLCMILADVARAEWPQMDRYYVSSYKKSERRTKALGFLRLSEVCMRFRALLLSMPAVWADSVFELPAGPRKLALARSQSAPLTAYIHYSYKLGTSSEQDAPDLIREQLLSTAVEHATRLRSLMVCGGFSSVHYHYLFANQLPLLETLDISYSCSKPTRPLVSLANVCIDAPVLQQARFQFGQDEGLQYLQLFGMGLTFNLPSLLHFDVSVSCSNSEVMLPVGWILDILQRSPFIKHLRLFIEDILDPIEWEAHFRGRDIQLAHLQSLQLSGDHLADMSTFFTQLRVSWPSRSISSFYHPTERPYEDEGADAVDIINDMLHFATTFGPSLQRESFNGLAVRVNEFDDFRSPTLNLRAFSAADNPIQYSDGCADDSAEYAELYLRSILSFRDPAHADVAYILANNLKHNTVTQLIIEAPMLEMWPLILQYIAFVCPGVAQLVVRHVREEEIDEYGDEEDGEESTRFGFPLVMQDGLFPALESMFIQPNHEIVNKEMYFAFWEGLIAWLGWRTRVGLRVRRLHVIGNRYLPKSDEDAEHEEREKSMCAQAADLVDEFADERVSLARPNEPSILTGREMEALLREHYNQLENS